MNNLRHNCIIVLFYSLKRRKKSFKKDTKKLFEQIPVIGEPPVFLGSVQVRDTESCLTSTILGGGGASGTSKKC